MRIEDDSKLDYKDVLIRPNRRCLSNDQKADWVLNPNIYKDQLPRRQVWNLAIHSSSCSGTCARFHSPAAYLLASASVG